MKQVFRQKNSAGTCATDRISRLVTDVCQSVTENRNGTVGLTTEVILVPTTFA